MRVCVCPCVYETIWAWKKEEGKEKKEKTEKKRELASALCRASPFATEWHSTKTGTLAVGQTCHGCRWLTNQVLAQPARLGSSDVKLWTWTANQRSPLSKV